MCRMMAYGTGENEYPSKWENYSREISIPRRILILASKLERFIYVYMYEANVN